MNFLSHGYLDARDFGLNMRLKKPCFLPVSGLAAASGFFTRFSLAGFSSPCGVFTFFGIMIVYLGFNDSFTPSVMVTLLIFFWMGDAEPRARGSMRFKIGPPSTRTPTTKR